MRSTSIPLFIIAILLTITGCAHAPKVVSAGSLSVSGSKHHHVFYSLPRADVEVAGEAVLKVFSPGPYTSELEEWLKTSSCDAADLMNRENACFWRFQSKRLPFANSFAACRRALPREKILDCVTADKLVLAERKEITDEEKKARKERETELLAVCNQSIAQMADLRQEAHLFFPTPLVAATKVTADPNAQFAVDLSPSAFEKLQYELAFTADGALTDFKATSTNTIAKTVEQSLGGLISKAVAADAADGGEILEALVSVMVEEEKRRETAYAHPDPAAMLADIDRNLAALRELAEGRIAETPLSIGMEVNPDGAMVDPSNTSESEKKLYAVVKQEAWPIATDVLSKALSNQMKCGDFSGGVTPPLITVDASVSPIENSRTMAENASNFGTKNGSVRYRVPVLATAAVTIACAGMEAAKCASIDKATIPVKGELVVPQWGPTLATPRSFGWAGGSVTAKLDAKTGVLLAISGKNDESLAGTLVNDAWQRELDKKKAAAQDSELSALQRQQAVLEAQVKICAAQETLGQDLGPECPTP